MRCLAAVAFMLGMLLCANARAAERPNVLYISIEDIAPLMGCYDHPIVKTPNIDALAGRGVVFHNAYCQIDMYPTLADLRGLGVPRGLEGTSMKPLLADPQTPWKKAAFTSKGPGQVSLRSERWRYTEWGSQKKAELYDHENNPNEFTNLARKAEHSATVAELRKLLYGGWRAALPESAQQ